MVITGNNGSGKTNLLEAVSLFAPGRGIRRSKTENFSRIGAASAWAVAADMDTFHGRVQIGTGLEAKASATGRSNRIVRIDGQTHRSTSVLADYLHISWLTPAMDGLFTGPAADRRRFMDRITAAMDPSFQKISNQFDRAMRQRNKLLDTQGLANPMFEGLEIQLAEFGVALAAHRIEMVEQIDRSIAFRRSELDSPFPWATIEIDGYLEKQLLEQPAIEVEDNYRSLLSENRAKDQAARRTLVGPHRTDFLIGHGEKNMPAEICSTGEQKALLINLVLANVHLVKQINRSIGPVILLDEVAAHLDEKRRQSLFENVLQLGGQVWMTGTDRDMFSSLGENAQYLTVDKGIVMP